MVLVTKRLKEDLCNNNNNNNNNNNTRTMFMVLSSCCSSIARVHPGSRGQCTTAPGGRRPLDQADRPEP